jgi:hypothetical protein
LPAQQGRSKPWLVPALYVLLLVTFAAGIWGSYRAVFPARNMYRATGVLVARPGDTMILVRHEAVSGLMDQMQSMLFFTESREVIDRAKISPGDRLRFTIKTTPDKLLVVDIQKIQ